MFEVRRIDDDELCGFVSQADDDEWRALTVFGALLATHGSRDGATSHVLEHGLASLADRWQLRRAGEDDAEIVCIQEADPGGVTLALGYYSLPGVPTLRVTRPQLDAGEWVLER